MPKLKAVIYLRVSRVDQRSGLQLDETMELVSRRGWTLVETYSDEGISGSKTTRPGLTKLREAARRRSFDVLVVWRSDRLFRSLRDLVVTLDELVDLDIGFVSVTEPFDTTTPSGKLMMQIVGAFAEFERNILKERTVAGLAAARRRGTRLGRPARVDADTLKRARELRRERVPLRTIATRLKVGLGTLHRALGVGS